MKRWLLACLPLTLAACEEPLWTPPGETVFLGAFTEFRVTSDAPRFCDGVPEYLDRYTGALHDELEVDFDGELTIYALGHPDEVRSFEDEGHLLGFSARAGILSGTPVLEHELVHAVQARSYGNQYLLTEGLAELFGGDAQTPDRRLTDGTAQELVEHVEEEEGIRGYAYGDAGRFVAYFDRRFGREALLSLLERSSRDDVTVEQFTSRVQEVTGLPWQEVAEEYDRSEVCNQHEYWNASPACTAAEPLSLCDGNEDVSHTVDLDCSAPDVLGERDDFTGETGPEVWTYRTVTFDKPGRYGMFILGQWGAESVGYLDLKRCSGGCGSFLQRFNVPTGPSVAEDFEIEEPGDYLLKIARPLDAESQIEFQIVGTCGGALARISLSERPGDQHGAGREQPAAPRRRTDGLGPRVVSNEFIASGLSLAVARRRLRATERSFLGSLRRVGRLLRWNEDNTSVPAPRSTLPPLSSRRVRSGSGHRLGGVPSRRRG